MDALAECHLRNGDVHAAATLYAALAKLQPRTYARRVRLCRVLSDPAAVPLPHRHRDVCEALLQLPALSPALLLHDAHDAAAVQRRYQRLVVHTHPDKNPQPNATRAFQRLVALKEQALQQLPLLTQQQQQHNDVDATAAVTATTTTTQHTQPHTTGGSSSHNMHAASASRAAVAASPREATTLAMPDWAALKQTRITLRSLHRRDIDDGFEIFASASRRLRREHSDYSDYSDDDDDDDDEWLGSGDGSSGDRHTCARNVATMSSAHTHASVDDNNDNDGHDDTHAVSLAATVPQATRTAAATRRGSHVTRRAPPQRAAAAAAATKTNTAAVAVGTAQATTTTTRTATLPPRRRRLPVHTTRAQPVRVRHDDEGDNNSTDSASPSTLHDDHHAQPLVVCRDDDATGPPPPCDVTSHASEVRTRIDGLLDELAQLRLRCTRVRLATDLRYTSYCTDHQQQQCTTTPSCTM